MTKTLRLAASLCAAALTVALSAQSKPPTMEEMHKLHQNPQASSAIRGTTSPTARTISAS